MPNIVTTMVFLWSGVNNVVVSHSLLCQWLL